jgi:N-methylhydantoinase B
MAAATVVHRAGIGAASRVRDADPVTTEVVRHGLNSAANQMKRALVRTAFSPVIYEVLDFAVAIYDERVRLLAQAPSLPMFMGRLSFCVQGAVDAVGGADRLRPGDVLLYNDPFGTGSHPQDAALVTPIHHDDELVGYAAVKAHWLDVGGKEPYSTDTVDVFQEGTIFPGVRLYAGGELVDDIHRIALANSRVPKMVAGDINAQVVALRVGTRAVEALLVRHGMETFRNAVERMFDHGEQVVRSYLERMPDGTWRAEGVLDDDGLGSEPVAFPVVVTIKGSDVTIDFTEAPPQRPGPVNCTLPKTVAVSRIAVGMLAGAGEAPNEGHYRPIRVITRPGTLFHPERPAPSFIGGWASFQAIETIYRAVAAAMPDAVTASSGGCICALVWWGAREATGEPWADGSPHPVGQGAHAAGDGANALMHVAESATRVTPAEVWESRNPWLLERVELIPDSGGAGRHRGGLGVSYAYRALEEMWLTTVVERTKHAPWALSGGREGKPNRAALRLPGGARALAKATHVRVPAGAVIELETGGGGGWGPPDERERKHVHSDVREGYVTIARARSQYPHAFEAR